MAEDCFFFSFLVERFSCCESDTWDSEGKDQLWEWWKLFAGEEDACVRGSETINVSDGREEKIKRWECRGLACLPLRDINRREERKMKRERENEEERRRTRRFLIAKHFLLSSSFCYYSSHVRLIVSHAQAYDWWLFFFILLFPIHCQHNENHGCCYSVTYPI